MFDFIKSFFKKNSTPNNSAEKIKTDLHSHLVPAIDDGAQNVEESESLIQALVNLGFTKIITTPHINVNFPNTSESIAKGFEILINYLASKNISISIEYAAEYMLDEGFAHHLKNGLLSFGKNHFVLIETSHHIKPDRFKDLIFDIQMKGYKPVFAHPERYLYLWNNKDSYFELKELGLLFQVNINSLSGYYTEKPKSIAKFLMKNGLVDFLGSDTHHQKHIEMLNKSLIDEALVSYLRTDKILNSLL